jgi:hypothetical protein
MGISVLPPDDLSSSSDRSSSYRSLVFGNDASLFRFEECLINEDEGRHGSVEYGYSGVIASLPYKNSDPV